MGKKGFTEEQINEIRQEIESRTQEYIWAIEQLKQFNYVDRDPLLVYMCLRDNLTLDELYKTKPQEMDMFRYWWKRVCEGDARKAKEQKERAIEYDREIKKQNAEDFHDDDMYWDDVESSIALQNKLDNIDYQMDDRYNNIVDSEEEFLRLFNNRASF